MGFMTYATTNDSYRWGFHPDYPGIEEQPEFVERYSEASLAETAERAQRVAVERGEMLFVGTWVTLYVFVSCSEFTTEVDRSIISQPIKDVSPWHPIDGDTDAARDIVLAVIDKVLGKD